MNLFKDFYKEVKTILFKYGEVLNDYSKSISNDSKYNLKENEWFDLIQIYLDKFCDDEERNFIKLLYFKKKSITYVSQNIYISERTCQEWREEILKNIIGLAIQEGLIKIDI